MVHSDSYLVISEDGVIFNILHLILHQKSVVYVCVGHCAFKIEFKQNTLNYDL